MTMPKKQINRERILNGLREIDAWKVKNGGVKNAPGETELRRKEKQLLKAKEKYYTQAREFIELWQKVKRAQREAK
jgi:hypothetical protein